MVFSNKTELSKAFLKKKKKIIFFLISTIFFVVIAAEAFYYSKFNKNYWLDELQVISHKKLKNHYPNFAPVDLIREKNFYSEVNKNNYFVFSGVSNTNTLLSCDDNIWISSLDKYGFNNKSEDWKNAEVFAFGDSQTYGSCSKKNFIEILNLNRKEKIINLSSPGNIISIDIALLKELIHKKKNKKIKEVLFFIYDESLIGISETMTNTILSKYFETENFNLNYFENKNEMDLSLIKDYEKKWKENNINKPDTLAKIKYFNFSIKKYFLKKENFTHNKKKNLSKELINENLNYFLKYIKILNKLSYENDFEYKIIFFSNRKNLQEDKELYKQVKEHLIKNHEKYYEIKKLIPETKLDKLYFKNSNHFSDYGHIEIAKILNNILK